METNEVLVSEGQRWRSWCTMTYAQRCVQGGYHLSFFLSFDCKVYVEQLYTVSRKKTVQNSFCQNFVRFPPTLIIFGTQIAQRINSCDVHLFSTSPNPRQRKYRVNSRCSVNLAVEWTLCVTLCMYVRCLLFRQQYRTPTWLLTATSTDCSKSDKLCSVSTE